jgi:hypothetical protein
MKPAFGGDIDPVDGVPVVVEIVLDGDGAFVRDLRFPGIPAGDEGNVGLHALQIIFAK